jgi:putative ABC transport system permease protein
VGNFNKDLRFAFRALKKRPVFTAVVVLTLALGTGATSAIFSLVDAVLLRPLPYRDAEQLVRVSQTLPVQGTSAPCSAGNFLDWQARNRVFSGMAAFQPAAFNLTGTDQPERLLGAKVTPDLFPLLGVTPMLGRAFAAGEGDPALAVLSYGLWQRRFAEDRGVIGRKLDLNGVSYRVIGVMPPGFSVVEGAELWTPLIFAPQQIASRGAIFLGVIARLKPGVSVEAAHRDMATIAEALAREHPVNEGWGVAVQSFREQQVGNIRGALLTLFGAVLFVLLVTCANVANLLLARATERVREIAIRTAMGADRRRLILQSLTEGMLLSLTGGALGLLVAKLGIRLLLALNPARIPNLDRVGVDLRVLGFTLALSLITGTIFGLVPVFQINLVRLFESLKEGGENATVARYRNRLRSLLVIAEVALALVLLIGAGLMVRSFRNLLEIDPGFRPEGAATAQVGLSPARYAGTPQRMQFFQQVLANIRTIPGVRYAGAVTTLPMSGLQRRETFFIEGREMPIQDQMASMDIVTPGYFQAMGIRLLQGRVFTERDQKGIPPTVVIDESMARRYWPGESPVGKRLGLPDVYETNAEIIGVVAGVRRGGLDREISPQLYVPLGVDSTPSMSLVVRTDNDASSLASALHAAVWAVDREQPLSPVRTLEDLVRQSVSQRLFNMRLMETFAALALVLAIVGIHGVLSYWVAQRRQEIGVRMAMGGKRLDILKLVLGRGMSLTAVGLGLGLAMALVLSRIVASLLFGVSPTDPLTFTALSLLLAAVALLACLLPARRAMSVDPIVALRQ